MGICNSTNNEEADQKKKSQQIDKILEEDSKRLRKECKILLLGRFTRRLFGLTHVLTRNHIGSGESGKSTIVKQMKIIHLKGYSEEELYNYRPTVFKNLVECAKAVINAMQQFNIEPQREGNQAHADYLLEYQTESGPQAHIEPQVGTAVQAIWNDPAKNLLMDHQTEFYLMDSAE
jgi:guanine nucleotide-binding protein subunit alpha